MNFSGHNGEIIKTQQAGNFWLTESICTPRTFVPKHFHQKACFCFIIQGSYTETFSRKVVEGTPFSLIYRPAAEVHSDHFGKTKVRNFIIEFEDKWLENISNYRLILNKPNCFQSDSLIWLATKIRHESQLSDDFTSLAIEGLMLELVSEIGRKHVRFSGPNQPRWLRQVKEFLHENFTEHISLAQLAESAGVHPVYLAEMFRRHYKCTVGEYIRRLRIEFAGRQISETDASLVEISLAAGFAHQAHFSRTFKRLTGFSPAQFRSISRRKP